MARPPFRFLHPGDPMLIQNKNLANHPLTIPGEFGGTATGSPLGIFTVPDEFGERLCATPGWSRYEGPDVPGPVAAEAPRAPR
ncbi:MAG: hypothetical protein M3Q55_13215, partial [Acidobacteriota bacterium]|nr:hypothetical protein [Acidobacteriota bacterium]